MPLKANVTTGTAIKTHRIASHRIASHRVASRRVASHRIAAQREPTSSISSDSPRNFFIGRSPAPQTCAQNRTLRLDTEGGKVVGWDWHVSEGGHVPEVSQGSKMQIDTRKHHLHTQERVRTYLISGCAAFRQDRRKAMTSTHRARIMFS
eukprot:3620253-Rhodomonas_salina.1